MSLSRRHFLAQGSAVGAAASIGLPFGTPAIAQDGPITIALASRAPTGISPQQAGLTGGDNWAIRQIFDTLVKADDGTFGIRPEDFGPVSRSAGRAPRMRRPGRIGCARASSSTRDTAS